MIDLAEMLASAKEQGYKEGREDAIDDYMNKLLNSPIVDKSVVRRIHEQLKNEDKNE